MHVDRRLLGWGLFFILVGGIPLATRAGLLDQQVVGQWPLLWPVLLIAWGTGLLLRGTPIQWVGGALAAITFGVMGGGALAAGFGGIPIASGCGNTGTGTAFASHTGAFGSTASADFEFSCGTFAMTAVDGSSWGAHGLRSHGRRSGRRRRPGQPVGAAEPWHRRLRLDRPVRVERDPAALADPRAGPDPQRR